jgi:hypothetical protein
MLVKLSHYSKASSFVKEVKLLVILIAILYHFTILLRVTVLVVFGLLTSS